MCLLFTKQILAYPLTSTTLLNFDTTHLSVCIILIMLLLILINTDPYLSNTDEVSTLCGE